MSGLGFESFVVNFVKCGKGLDGSVEACCSWLCYSRSGSVGAHSWGSYGAHRIGRSWKSVLVRRPNIKELGISLIYFSICLHTALVVFSDHRYCLLVSWEYVLVALSKWTLSLTTVVLPLGLSWDRGSCLATTGCALLRDAGTCLFRWSHWHRPA